MAETGYSANHGIVNRMQRAAMLQPQLYEEVEADSGATGQAAAVVAIVAVCSAIGGAGGGIGAIVTGLLGAFFGWLIWSGLTYLIGDKLLGGTATWGELLRTLGFAQAPGVLYLLAIIPFFGWIVRFAVAVWILIAGIIAIRQALDFGSGKAIGTALLGWLVLLVLSFGAAMLGWVGGLMA